MINCTVVLVLLTVLIATEADPQETPPQDTTANAVRTPRRTDARVSSDRSLFPATAKSALFDRQSL